MTGEQTPGTNLRRSHINVFLTSVGQQRLGFKEVLGFAYPLFPTLVGFIPRAICAALLAHWISGLGSTCKTLSLHWIP